MNPAEFENLARAVFSKHFAVQLHKIKLPGHPKTFDLVSQDGQIVGDAKYLSMVRGEKAPPAKWSVIAEHVWLLEKTQATVKFIVFGNDQRVVRGWIERWGQYMNPEIHFYFMKDSGALDRFWPRVHGGEQ